MKIGMKIGMKMKVALIGYGKMGQMVAEEAEKAGDVIVARINSSDWDEKAIADADVCIEFTTPEAAVRNIEKACLAGKPIVVGTTGWYDHLEAVCSIVEANQGALLWGANFSIGVHLFSELSLYLAKMAKDLPGWDMAGVEWHHKHKKDAPSGTAKVLSEKIKKKSAGRFDFDFSYVRCGAIPGTYEIVLENTDDVITITHAARSRHSYAQGALMAARKLIGRKGMFAFEEIL